MGRPFRMSLRNRLLMSFLVATCLTGLVATLVGIRIIKDSMFDQVQRKVREDINTARLIYNHDLERLLSQVQFITLRWPLEAAIEGKDAATLKGLCSLLREKSGKINDHRCLDMLTIVDSGGKVVYRAANPDENGDSILWDRVVYECLTGRRPVSSTELIPLGHIIKESPKLAQKVRIPIVKTEKSVVINKRELSSGMVLRAAHPVIDREDRLVGAVVGGILINKDYSIVDKIKSTVYYNEKYKGKDMGFATIFQDGIRISTNVMTKDSRRAIGTIVSRDVYDKVIGRGEDWIGRAFVVNDWYISSYTPIKDIDEKIIGMLYTGILEAKYRDIQVRTMWIFLGITFLGIVVAFFISMRLGGSIIRRIRLLKTAAEAIAEGNLDYQLEKSSLSGFDILDDAFNNMAKSLKDRDDRLKEAFHRIMRTERLASLGLMAAGVAHEINNPLGGILLYSNLVLEDMPTDHPSRQNMRKIVYQTNRCKDIVQNLLDFARAPSGEYTTININDVIRTSLELVKDQSDFFGITIKSELTHGLPLIRADKSRMEEVFLNLFLNAADAMKGKGTLEITTALTGESLVRITVGDTGRGIDRAYLPHIFEPFFTTKDPGQGTGLGLSITYSIIRQHNGLIDVESDRDEGTKFIITLPPEGSDLPERLRQEERFTIG